MLSEATSQVEPNSSPVASNSRPLEIEPEQEESIIEGRPVGTASVTGSAPRTVVSSPDPDALPTYDPNPLNRSVSVPTWLTRSQPSNGAGSYPNNLDSARSSNPRLAFVLGLPSSLESTSSYLSPAAMPNPIDLSSINYAFKADAGTGSGAAALLNNIEAQVAQFDTATGAPTRQPRAAVASGGQRPETDREPGIAAFSLLLHPNSTAAGTAIVTSENWPAPLGPVRREVSAAVFLSDGNGARQSAETGGAGPRRDINTDSPAITRPFTTDALGPAVNPVLNGWDTAVKPQSGSSDGGVPIPSFLSPSATQEDGSVPRVGTGLVEDASQPRQAFSSKQPDLIDASTTIDESSTDFGTQSSVSIEANLSHVTGEDSLRQTASRTASPISFEPINSSRTPGLPASAPRSPKDSATQNDNATADDNGTAEKLFTSSLAFKGPANEAIGSTPTTSPKNASAAESLSAAPRGATSSKESASAGTPPSTEAVDRSGHGSSNTQFGGTDPTLQSSSSPEAAFSQNKTKSSSETQRSGPDLPMDSAAPGKGNAQAVGPVKEITIRVQASSGETVHLKVVDQVNQVEVGVRSSNPSLASSLQKDLSSLTATLDRLGWKSELTPAPSPDGMPSTTEPNPGGNDQSDSSQSEMAAEWWNNPDQNRRSSSELWDEALNRQPL